MSAIVCRIEKIEKHPNADKLELLNLTWSDRCELIDDEKDHRVQVVTGPHYLVGSLGVFIEAGSFIPGYMVEDFWLGGRGSTKQWFQVVSKNMRGIESPGIFGGQVWQIDRTKLWRVWDGFKDWWTVGMDVSAYLGIRNDVPVGSVSTYASKH